MNVYCSLFESKMIRRVPKTTKQIAVTSYFFTNFSPRYLCESHMLKITAVEELQAIKVRSA